MAGKPLYEHLGQVIHVLAPDQYATDVATSDNDAGAPIKNADGILFVLSVGELPTATDKGTVDVTLQYSSDGLSTNVSTSSDVWPATDAVFAQVDSDGENEIYLLDLDLDAKGADLKEEASKIYADFQVVGAQCDFGLIAIPYGVRHNPVSQENTVVHADYVKS